MFGLSKQEKILIRMNESAERAEQLLAELKGLGDSMVEIGRQSSLTAGQQSEALYKIGTELGELRYQISILGIKVDKLAEAVKGEK